MINSLNVEHSFQAILQWKIDNYNDLSKSDQVFVDHVYENGYSMIRVSFSQQELTKAGKVQKIVEDCEIKYYTVHYYYAVVVGLIALGFYGALINNYECVDN